MLGPFPISHIMRKQILYCIIGNIRENFIFANIDESHIFGVKISD